MGTDIRFVFQRRDGEKWIDVESNYSANKYYMLFAWLGDVRNEYGIRPIASNRGFPDDFEWKGSIEEGTVRHNGVWMGDHNWSWVTSKEILDYKFDRDDEICTIETIEEFIAMIRKLHEKYGTVRMVFGFDS